MASRLECVEKVICKGERFLEAHLQRSDVDKELLISLRQAPSSTFLPLSK
jgi:hypothetical protein